MPKTQAVGSFRFRFKAVTNRIIFRSLGGAETLHFLAANKPTRSCHKKHVRLLACLARSQKRSSKSGPDHSTAKQSQSKANSCHNQVSDYYQHIFKLLPNHR